LNPSNKHHFAILSREQEKIVCESIVKTVNKNKLITVSGDELVYLAKQSLQSLNLPVAKSCTPQYLRKMFMKQGLTCPSKLYQKSQRHFLWAATGLK
jgi:hypothetical protein